MTWHLAISPQSEPQDAGLDENGWAQATFAVLGWKRHSSTPWLDDLTRVLEAALVADERTTLFMSSAATLPAPGPNSPECFLVLTATLGGLLEGTHNDGPGAYRRPGARITAHGKTWPLALELAEAAHTALLAVRNQDVSASA